MDQARAVPTIAVQRMWLGMNEEANQAAKRANQLDPTAFEIFR
jgi:hypothetical protein